MNGHSKQHLIAMERRAFVGGSDLGPILGLSQFKDEYTLYLEKRGELDPPAEETKAQRRGQILEAPIAELYAAEREVEIVPGAIVPGSAPWMRAQVDRFERQAEGPLIPIEIKSASEYTRGKWGRDGTDEAPTDYCAQLHWQMLCTGAPFGRIVALLGVDDLRVYTLDRDEKINAFLLEKATAFWQRVQDGTPPEPDYQHPALADTLARLFTNPNATEILQATPELVAWRDVMAQSSALALQYEKSRDTARAHLLLAMGNAGVINFGDGQSFERKVIKRKGYTVAAMSYVDGRLKNSTPAGVPALTDEVANHG